MEDLAFVDPGSLERLLDPVTCARCGMVSGDWTANDGDGVAVDGQRYCCEGCAEGTACTCREYAPDERSLDAWRGVGDLSGDEDEVETIEEEDEADEDDAVEVPDPFDRNAFTVTWHAQGRAPESPADEVDDAERPDADETEEASNDAERTEDHRRPSDGHPSAGRPSDGRSSDGRTSAALRHDRPRSASGEITQGEIAEDGLGELTELTEAPEAPDRAEAVRPSGDTVEPAGPRPARRAKPKSKRRPGTSARQRAARRSGTTSSRTRSARRSGPARKRAKRRSSDVRR
jgi:hypothetical protein